GSGIGWRCCRTTRVLPQAPGALYCESDKERVRSFPFLVRSRRTTSSLGLDQDAFEMLKASLVCDRCAQALAQFAGDTITPQRRHIHVRIGELRERNTQDRKRSGGPEVDAH